MAKFDFKLGEGQYAAIEQDGAVKYYQGRIHKLRSLQELKELQRSTKREIVFVNPFNSALENGYEAHGEEPILALEAFSVLQGTREEIVELMDFEDFELKADFQPRVEPEVFAETVREIQEKEIDGGEATQVILSNIFEGSFDKELSAAQRNELYRRFLQQRGQYMTFAFGMEKMEGLEDDQIEENEKGYFVGATPERHLTVKNGEARMTPIAGTMKKIAETFVDKLVDSIPQTVLDNLGDDAEKINFARRLIDFLRDSKEINELFMVLDEELKMMAEICPEGGSVEGPFLRESGKVIHTEYDLHGHTTMHPIDALKKTLHAPTLVGGPEESAMRIIKEYEPESRRYYGGEIGVLDNEGNMDSAIMIRFIEVIDNLVARVQAGAGIVRQSDPLKEAAEVAAKASGALNSIKGEYSHREMLSKQLKAAFKEILDERNKDLSVFHFRDQSSLDKEPRLVGKKILIVDNEDRFSRMLGHMAKHLGCEVEVVSNAQAMSHVEGKDVVILGPGPGDINDPEDEKMKGLLSMTEKLRAQGVPLLGICLGHQAISKTMGMEVVRQEKSSQGLQLEREVFGNMEKVGFYNSFSPVAQNVPEDMEVSENEGRVIAMRQPGIVGYQFHPESVMSKNGYEFLKEALLYLAA